MIPLFKKQRLIFITAVYWFLLAYIIAALVWWFIALENQNRQMFSYKVEQINKNDAFLYSTKYASIEKERKRKKAQYIEEGTTFFLVILIGAVFVYRSVRNQIYLSQQQQNFMMAVTHELKTPIAIIHLSLETMQKRKLEPLQQQKLMDNALYEVNRLNSLTNNILAASELESGKHAVDKELINLSEVIHQVIKEFKSRYPHRIITTDISAEIETTGEKLLLQLLFSNLLDNALKYSAKDKPAGVVLQKQNDKIILQIIDEGDGINDAEKKKIFDKFYRTGNEVTRRTQGTGLGLYLCKRIIKDHKGTISVKNNQPTGTIFSVILHTA